MTDRLDPALAAGNLQTLAGYAATHFAWKAEAGVATLTLNRPERKNPLTFDSYAELRDLFLLRHDDLLGHGLHLGGLALRLGPVDQAVAIDGIGLALHQIGPVGQPFLVRGADRQR